MKVFKREDFESEEEMLKMLNWHRKMHFQLAKKLSGLSCTFSWHEDNLIPLEIWSAVAERSLFEDNELQ